MKKMMMDVLMVLAIGFMLAGCSSGSQDDSGPLAQGQKIKTVATTGMIGDLVKNIGGEHVELKVLMGPGVDPHLYKASEGDVAKLQDADIIFYNGLHLEAKMAEIFEGMKGKKRTVAVSDGIPRDQLLSPQEFKGQYDPHVWFDVTLWMKAAQTVKEQLIAHDPKNAESYEKNAEQYLQKMDEVHQYIAQKAASVPERQRVLITAHDAFNYFGRQYGFEVKGLQGISTAAEAGAKDVQDLAQFIADNQIPAIFVESSVPERNIRAVQDAARAKGWEVAIGGSLYSDAMGDEGTFQGTYQGMVSANIDTITSALSEKKAS